MVVVSINRERRNWTHSYLPGFLGMIFRGNYNLASMYPNKPADIYKIAQSANVPHVQGMIPTERTLFDCGILAGSVYLCYALLKVIRDRD